MKKIKGCCNCGAINFAINTQDIVKVVNCHCDLCRKINGCAFSSYVVVKENGFTFTAGVNNITSHKVSQNATKSFCAICGTPIYNSNSKYFGLKILYLGILENADQLSIDANIFCDTWLTWVKQISEITSFRQSTKSERIQHFLVAK